MTQRTILPILIISLTLTACSIPKPPASNIPTSPAVLIITPAPTLDIDATATVLANQLRPTPTPAGLYIVQDGDTLSSLAEQFDTTVEEILAINGLTDPNALKQGQGLIIPSLLKTPITQPPVPSPSPTGADEGNVTVSPTIPPEE